MHGENHLIEGNTPSDELGGYVQAGYAVIFLHRRHSIQPFTKGLPSGQILDFMTSVLEPDEGEGAPGCHLQEVYPFVRGGCAVHL